MRTRGPEDPTCVNSALGAGSLRFLSSNQSIRSAVPFFSLSRSRKKWSKRGRERDENAPRVDPLQRVKQQFEAG